MPTYTLNAVNIASFPLGETDKILTVFSAERGIVRAVAKGARKPGTKMSGRSDVLHANKLLIAKGRSLDIITQAETIESYPNLRQDLIRLSFSLYYAELTKHFGQGLTDESLSYFDYLCQALRLQSDSSYDPLLLCLTFELGLLDLLGYKPEINYCVVCRSALTEYTLAVFHYELGGIICESCFSKNRMQTKVTESEASLNDYSGSKAHFKQKTYNKYNSDHTHITPMVWKSLVLAAANSQNVINNDATETLSYASNQGQSTIMKQATRATQRVLQNYIEHRIGKKMKALDLIASAI